MWFLNFYFILTILIEFYIVVFHTKLTPLSLNTKLLKYTIVEHVITIYGWKRNIPRIEKENRISARFQDMLGST